MHELTMDHTCKGDIADLAARCPKCQSASVESRNIARRFGGAIGVIVGATSGIAGALGIQGGVLTGPVRVLRGSVADVVIEGIVSGAMGCAAGSRLGSSIDMNILRNRHCRCCGHTFSDRFS